MAREGSGCIPSIFPTRTARFRVVMDVEVMAADIYDAEVRIRARHDLGEHANILMVMPITDGQEK